MNPGTSGQVSGKPLDKADRRRQRRRLRLRRTGPLLSDEPEEHYDEWGELVALPEDVNSSLLRALADLEKSVAGPETLQAEKSVAAPETLQAEPLVSSQSIAGSIHGFIETCRQLLKEHCEKLICERAISCEKQILADAYASLQELVPERDRLAREKRMLSVDLPEDHPIYSLLSRWDEEERQAMKFIIEERLLQLLTSSVKPDLDTLPELTRTATEVEPFDQDLLDQLKRARKEVDQLCLTGQAPVVNDTESSADLDELLAAIKRLNLENDELKRQLQALNENMERVCADLDAKRAKLEAANKRRSELRAESSNAEANKKAAEEDEARRKTEQEQEDEAQRKAAEELEARRNAAVAEEESSRQAQMAKAKAKAKVKTKKAIPVGQSKKKNPMQDNWPEEKAQLLHRIAELEKELSTWEARIRAHHAEVEAEALRRKTAAEEAFKLKELRQQMVAEGRTEEEIQRVFDNLYNESFERVERLEGRQRRNALKQNVQWAQKMQDLQGTCRHSEVVPEWSSTKGSDEGGRLTVTLRSLPPLEPEPELAVSCLEPVRLIKEKARRLISETNKLAAPSLEPVRSLEPEFAASSFGQPEPEREGGSLNEITDQAYDDAVASVGTTTPKQRLLTCGSTTLNSLLVSLPDGNATLKPMQASQDLKKDLPLQKSAPNNLTAEGLRRCLKEDAALVTTLYPEDDAKSISLEGLASSLSLTGSIGPALRQVFSTGQLPTSTVRRSTRQAKA